MSAAVLSLLLQAIALPPSVAPPTERWEPWMSWGCLVRESKRKSYVINGVIARRDEPDHLTVHRRHERALRVLRDDSGAFAGLQARWPMFVVHPKQYWAFFRGPDGKQFGPGTRSIILTKGGDDRPVKVELFARGDPGTKPYASGQCVGRDVSKEAES